MLYPSVNELRKKTDSRYSLVILTAKRARDLVDGKPPLSDSANCDRPVSIAAWEIEEDQISYKRDASALDGAVDANGTRDDEEIANAELSE